MRLGGPGNLEPWPGSHGHACDGNAACLRRWGLSEAFLLLLWLLMSMVAISATFGGDNRRALPHQKKVALAMASCRHSFSTQEVRPVRKEFAVGK